MTFCLGMAPPQFRTGTSGEWIDRVFMNILPIADPTTK
jgi:hypothetical protein